jgi:MFS family permease
LGFIIASALTTLDGTATTVALPAMARVLSASVAQMQWIVNAPLMVLAAMLLPSGALADRFGRTPIARIGLLMFVAASILCAISPSSLTLIAAKAAQGIGGALVLPAALAALREAESNAAERTRLFGIWAACTGAASALGPILAGALVDIWSWRAVFLLSTATGLLALVLLRGNSEVQTERRSEAVPITATLALMILVGAVAYLLIQGPRGDLTGSRLGLPLVLAVASGVTLVVHPRSHQLLPRELLHTQNCLPANATTFALYFGLFGLSFLAVLYVQQVLQISALWSAVVLLPMSATLLLAERFGKLATIVGTRPLVIAGAVLASVGLGWIAASPHPVPFWSRMMVGTGLFGLGISVAVSTLTHAAVAAVPATCAGAASGLNHAVVRAAGLVAVSLLGSLAAPGVSDSISAEGFQRAMLVCTAIVGAGGIAGTAWLRDHAPGGVTAEEQSPSAAGSQS